MPVWLAGRCPRCGKGRLFDGVIAFADSCDLCGLDYARFNVGDGPAAFLTLIVGAAVVGCAIWFELAVGPPLWVHLLIWIPLSAAAVIVGLRLAKAWLLTAEYRRSAGEAGRENIE